MLKLFEAQHHAEAAMVVHLLEAVGIGAAVRGESLLTTVEGAPAIPGLRPTVWVEDTADVDLAREVVERFSQGQIVTLPGETPWTCACGEPHEAQFGACWSCGAPRP